MFTLALLVTTAVGTAGCYKSTTVEAPKSFPAGRYAMHSNGPRVFLLDTIEGNVWEQKDGKFTAVPVEGVVRLGLAEDFQKWLKERGAKQ